MSCYERNILLWSCAHVLDAIVIILALISGRSKSTVAVNSWYGQHCMLLISGTTRGEREVWLYFRLMMCFIDIPDGKLEGT